MPLDSKRKPWALEFHFNLFEDVVDLEEVLFLIL